MDNLHISTMTCISNLNTDINLDNPLFDNLSINKSIKFIEHGIKGYKGNSEKKNKKIRKPIKKKVFFNQVTIHYQHDKLVNVKVFNNGKIQMTGVKYEQQGLDVINSLIKDIIDIDVVHENKIFNKEVSNVDTIKIVLINSDFNIGFLIDREILRHEMKNYDIIQHMNHVYILE